MHPISPVILSLFIFTLSLPGLSGESAFSKRTYVYKTVGNCAVQADVYRASDNAVRLAILWIHGGALIVGHRGTIRTSQLDEYLKAGFVVVSIDYRLAPETKLAKILLAQGSYCEAIASLEQAASLDPSRKRPTIVWPWPTKRRANPKRAPRPGKDFK